MAILKDILGSCSTKHRDTYQACFDSIDSDRDGRILGDEANGFFSRTGIDSHQLKKVWAYADSKGQGFLGFEEFIAAMQLLSLAQKGWELNADCLQSTFCAEHLVMEGLVSLLEDYRSSRINEGNVGPVGPVSSLKRCLSSKLRKKVDKVTSKVDGLKQLYIEKLKPLEVAYHYDVFASPLLTNGDFDAKPMVLVLGKYSTGKTSFIKYFLEGNYPGAEIGPEPTTKKFTVIMDGPVERIVKGSNIVDQVDMPFKGLTCFGDTFLSNFECSQMPNPNLEHITVVDTPGVLDGDMNRSYDFTGVIKWFAEKCDIIILMFDPRSIDISDEFKRVITSSFRGQDDKIRVVLNKADQLDDEQLIRICSALTLSIGMVLNNPSPMHIYMGSFNRTPVNNLFTKEEHKLRSEMKGISELVIQNQIEKFRKRARSAKLHAHIIGQLKKEMPAIGMRGKAKARDKLVQKLENVFEKVQRSLHLPASDFPDVEHFRKVLHTFKIHKFKKLKPKLIKHVDEILESDIGELMEKFKNTF